MRLARLRVEGAEMLALEHQGSLYRVDRLDRVLGVPVPDVLRARASDFQARLFAMGGVGLEEHEAELRDGTLLDDCRLGPSELTAWLPPWGQSGTLHELEPGATLPRPLGGKAVRGHLTRAPGLDEGPLWVTPALALIVGDELHLTSEGEVRRSLIGVTLALAWRSPSAGRRGFERLPGTHLGPWLVAPVPDGDVVLVMSARGGRPERLQVRVPLGPTVARAASALAALAAHQDIAAGDAVLVLCAESMAVKPREPVTLTAEGLGELRGRVG